MKSKLVGLQSSVSTTYVPNSTTVTATLGRARQKTLNGKQVIGPSLSKFIDIQTITGTAPGYCYFVPTQNQLFIAQNTTTNNPVILLFNFDGTTGTTSFVGRITLNLANSAATTSTHRGICVISNGTNIRIYLATTGSVAINSGIYVAYCTVSQFTPSGTTLFPASGSGQNAIYLLQSSDYYGVNAVTGFNNSHWGVDIPYLSTNPALNTKLYSVSNTVATPCSMVWETSITPNVDGQVINGVSSSTSIIAGTSPAAYFSSASLPGYSGTNWEPVCLQIGTGNVPTPFNAWLAGTAQTTSNTYFTRDVQRLFTFTCTALTSAISAGSTYVIIVGPQTLTFTVTSSVSIGATSFAASLALPAQPTNPQTPPTSGILTRSTGTGPVSITFSSFTLGNFCFNLSATTGAAASIPTQVQSNFSMLRAFGTSTNQFVARTPITGFSPVLSGTLLQTNVVNHAKPVSAPLNPALNGQDCLSFATSTNLYLGNLAQLIVLSTTGNTTLGSTTISGIPSTSGLAAGMAVIGPAIPAGATISSVDVNSIVISAGANSTTTGSSLVFGTNNWTSLTTSNTTGTGIDVVAPTLAFSRYSGVGTPECIDGFVGVVTPGPSVLIKPLQNNFITASFGGTDNQYYETLNLQTIYGAYMATIIGMTAKSGWIFLTGGTTGQRGIMAIDAVSEANFGVSALISPVNQIQNGCTLQSISTIEELHDITGNLNFWIRSSLLNDSTFASANIPTPSVPFNWTRIYTSQQLNSIAIGPYYQICLTYQVISLDTQTPAQVVDVEFSYTPPSEMSDNWEGSVDNTSINGASPSYTAFRMKFSDSGTKYFRAYDNSGNLVVSANTSANFTSFDKSTNNGATWSPMTGPNDYSSTPLTTEIRYKWALPPGVDVTVSLRDS